MHTQVTEKYHNKAVQTDNLRAVRLVVSLSLNFTTRQTAHKLRLTAALYPNTYMKEYIQQLSKTSCDALNYCIGKPIQSVLSPSSDLRLGSTIVTTQSVSIRIGTREFLVIENDWADTPEEYHDYYFLEASISDRPKEITVNAQKSSCLLYTSPSPRD